MDTRPKRSNNDGGVHEPCEGLVGIAGRGPLQTMGIQEDLAPEPVP